MLNIAATANKPLPRISLGKNMREADPSAGFAHAGEFFLAVKRAYSPGPRLRDELCRFLESGKKKEVYKMMTQLIPLTQEQGK